MLTQLFKISTVFIAIFNIATPSVFANIPEEASTWYYTEKYNPKEDRDKQFTLDLKVKQKGESYENSAESSFLYTVDVRPEFKYQPTNFLTLNFDTSISSRIGSVQTRFGDLRSRSAIIIRDTRLKLYNQYESENKKVNFNSYYSVGAIDQGGHHRNFSNFISRTAMPGFEERFVYSRKIGVNDLILDLRSFQGIPTSQSNTLDFNDKEDTPTFVSINFGATFKREYQKTNFKVALDAGLFDFSDLPAVIADESRLYGNTVNGVNSAAEFEYGFRGWFGGWYAAFSKGKLSASAGVQMLQNLDAPDTLNQAQKAFVKLKYMKSSNYSYEIQPFFFFTERDASIASYNSLAGHNNREGFGLSAELEMKPKGLKFKLDFAQSEVIDRTLNNNQLDQSYIGFSLEYKNDLI